MDKFEEAMDSMKNMNEEDRVKMIEAKKGECICAGCPSYNECAKEEKQLLFCALGKSNGCINEEKGCTCPQCPITPEMGLKNEFYCTKGSEKERRNLWLNKVFTKKGKQLKKV